MKSCRHVRRDGLDRTSRRGSLSSVWRGLRSILKEKQLVVFVFFVEKSWITHLCFGIKEEYLGCVLLRIKRLPIIQTRYPGLNVDTSELTLFPLCERPYYHLVNFSFLPLLLLRHTHTHTHIVALQRQWFKTHRVQTRERNPGLMSQPPHLQQETKGLGVKCRLLCRPRGVERLD